MKNPLWFMFESQLPSFSFLSQAEAEWGGVRGQWRRLGRGQGGRGDPQHNGQLGSSYESHLSSLRIGVQAEAEIATIQYCVRVYPHTLGT